MQRPPLKPPEPRRPPAAASAVLPSAATTRSAPPDATQRIAQAITTAIVERRLMPGTKLAEQKIADIFKVSRTLVRQALNQLSRDKLVTLEPARGARVAEPSVEEARQVFEVRRMLESAMVERAARELTDVQLTRLREHLAEELAAVQRTDVPGRTRLLADFHVLVAGMLGNAVLADMLADLVSRSSLIALMYQSAHSAEHSSAEHVAIVDALARRDAAAAVRLMQQHLAHVERNLQLHPRIPDLAAVLAPRAPPQPSITPARPAAAPTLPPVTPPRAAPAPQAIARKKAPAPRAAPAARAPRPAHRSKSTATT